MTTIIRSGIARILNIFYQRKKQGIHLREIARMTNLNGRGLSHYLQKLENEKVLSSKKQGNLKIYSATAQKKTFALYTLFDVNKEESLSHQRKTAIRSYLNTLPEQPIFAILFGSTAKGTATEHSDIDILIITNKKIHTAEAEKEADALAAIKISTFQMNYQDFLKELKLKEDPVVQSALQTGFPLINHVHYYEALYDERL